MVLLNVFFDVAMKCNATKQIKNALKVFMVALTNAF